MGETCQTPRDDWTELSAWLRAKTESGRVVFYIGGAKITGAFYDADTWLIGGDESNEIVIIPGKAVLRALSAYGRLRQGAPEPGYAGEDARRGRPAI